MNNNTTPPLFTEQSEKKGIVLNRMYTGSYLSSNLGHEVINLFQDDQGKHYLYLNAKGNYANMHHMQISDMLLVRYAGVNEGKSEVQVLGWTKGLEPVFGSNESCKGYDENSGIFIDQQTFINDNKITYGGADLIKLFEGSDQQNIYITYSATEFYRPQIPVYIQYVTEEDLLNTPSQATIHEEVDKIILNLSGYQFGKATLKQYIYPATNKNGKFKLDKRKKTHQEAVKKSGADRVVMGVMEKREADWNVLLKLLDEGFAVDGQPLWKKDEPKSKTVYEEGLNSFEKHHTEISLFDIMPKLQRDENCFSDALKFFMNRDKDAWEEIFRKMCSDDNIGTILSIDREKDATISDKHKNEDQAADVDNNDNSSGGRIDLLIRTENAYIVIENKIKSDINRTKGDSKGEDQLDRYKQYIKHCMAEQENIKSYFFILAPDYNMPSLEERKGYVPLYYSILVGKSKKGLNNEEVVKLMRQYHETHKNENLWSAFHDAMKRHSYDYENDSLYEDMKNTFFTRIQKVSSNKDNNA